MPHDVGQALAFDEAVRRCRAADASQRRSSSASFAGRVIALESDEPSIFDGFFIAFGGAQPVPGRADGDPFLTAIVTLGTDDRFGSLILRARDAEYPMQQALFGLDFSDCPYETMAEGDWTLLRLRGEANPFIAYQGTVCLFDKRQEWEGRIVSVIYRAALHLAADVIFFHASALSVGGRGVMIVGPRKAGKSTTALALAGRGHAVLGDSAAAYSPSTGQLVPFRRPVGVREGPRSRVVEAALRESAIRAVHREDSLRVDVATLLPEPDARPVDIDSIFILDGFAPATEIRRVAPDRNFLPMLQPIQTAFVNAPPAQRMFELIRLISRVRLFVLRPGDPDEAARAIEEVILS